MNEPKRLRDGDGPAAMLLARAELEVPSASRKRALAFTGAAASMLASSGAAAAASGAALAKSVMLWVVVGTVGGGLLSLTVAQTISSFEARGAAKSATTLPLPPPRAPVAPPRAPAVAPPPPESVATAPEVAESPSEGARSPGSINQGRSAGSSKPSPAPVGAAVSKPAVTSSLFDEQRSIEMARAAVSRGDASSALATLDDYQRAYPQGRFGPEALALRVEALRAQGNIEGARAFARQFERRFPHHPLLSRVQAAAQR
jgi:hypothetical protein